MERDETILFPFRHKLNHKKTIRLHDNAIIIIIIIVDF